MEAIVQRRFGSPDVLRLEEVDKPVPRDDEVLVAEQRYDVMLDLIGNRSLLNCRRVLAPRGTYVIVGVRDLGRWLELNRQIKALVLSLFVRQRRACSSSSTPERTWGF